MLFFRTSLLLTILLAGVYLSMTAAGNPFSAAESSNNFYKLPEQETLHNWIEKMKMQRRGPFKRIRWFCKDGTILPPKPYACRGHDGGVQHGEWTDQIKQLRQHNYLIANLLADLSPEAFFARPDWDNHLKQIILEQFMREADNGWIFRRVPYYKGALQTEDENWHGHSLLLGLLQQPELRGRYFLLLREAVRFLPHGHDSPPLTAMRQLAQRIGEQDTGFAPLRIKLHSQPEPADAVRVRRYAQTGRTELQRDYLKLSELIDQVTSPQSDPFEEAIRLRLSPKSQKDKPISVGNSAPADLPVETRFVRTCQLLIKIRTELEWAVSNSRQLEWLDLSHRLEFEFYSTANQLLDLLPTASRRQQLDWIKQGIDALYGTGMLSRRERDSLSGSLQKLLTTPLSVETYQRELAHLARLTRWAENRLRYHFEIPLNHLARLDVAFRTFIPERLRASPLLPISRMIDSLQTDSQQLRGASHWLFGAPSNGLQPLNPGLARGRLELVEDPQQHNYSADGIYLLPETVEDLPPVAGILTRGAGNALSHIQLLARNLGIPNLVIDNQLLAEFAAHQGEMIVVAVSPGGVIRIETDSEHWQTIFKQKEQRPNFLIEPDLQKLDLQQKNIISLNQLGSKDSGRIAGPKGANLGELKQIYQGLVPDALVIPFGRFRQFLERTSAPDGQKLFDWIRSNYQHFAAVPDAAGQSVFLARLREQIVSAPLDPDFLDELRASLDTSFGADGSYGIFVRSDTNVEDLPNFSGAGLNRTVPHVVGFTNIVQAIRTVWASPFTDRAFSWRQAHMNAPEQIYASVLLMLSVPVDKSGVMATSDPVTGNSGFLRIAANEGIGGAVSGQRAEEVLIDRKSGEIHLLAQASATQKYILLPRGGVQKIPATAPDRLLSRVELEILRQMAKELPARFPDLRNPDGSYKAADIEFGFLDGKFVLFQIRPLVESKRVHKELLLQQFDAELNRRSAVVNLDQSPAGWQP